MKFVLLFTILSLFIVACSNTNQAGNTIEKTTTKSVSLNDFKLPAISNEANQDLEKWVDFRSLIQVMVGMAPNKIKNADNFTIKNPDSLVTYKRLYPKSSKAILKNVTIDKDWRKVDGINDSIFRFQKRNNSELTYLLWKEYLLKDISYTFSIFLRNMNYPTILFEVSDEQKKMFPFKNLNLTLFLPIYLLQIKKFLCLVIIGRKFNFFTLQKTRAITPWGYKWMRMPNREITFCSTALP